MRESAHGDLQLAFRFQPSVCGTADGEIMTLEELAHNLPNGLHDAELLGLNVDYVGRTISLIVEVWVGDIDGPIETRETYRKARIDVSGLQFLVIEPPDPTYPYSDVEASRIDICDMSKNLDVKLVRSLPDGTSLSSLWVNDWNAFAHIAAQDATLSWLDPKPTCRTRREHYLPGETANR